MPIATSWSPFGTSSSADEHLGYDVDAAMRTLSRSSTAGIPTLNYLPQSLYTPPSRPAPTLPSYNPAPVQSISPTQIAAQTAQGNLAAAGSNTHLADIINAVNQAAQQAANKGRLGPQGEAIQNMLLENTMAQASGQLDPTTEMMLRSGIAQRYGAAGMGVDSPALYSAYTRATGGNILANEQAGLQGYLQLLAANPSAPIFNMGELMTSPGTVAQVSEANASRQQSANQFAANYALQQAQLQQQAQQAADALAYKYYESALAQANRAAAAAGGYSSPDGGGYSIVGGGQPSAAAYNTRQGPTVGIGGSAGVESNPFTGQVGPYGAYGYYPSSGGSAQDNWNAWYSSLPQQTVNQDYTDIFYSPTYDPVQSFIDTTQTPSYYGYEDTLDPFYSPSYDPMTDFGY